MTPPPRFAAIVDASGALLAAAGDVAAAQRGGAAALARPAAPAGSDLVFGDGGMLLLGRTLAGGVAVLGFDDAWLDRLAAGAGAAVALRDAEGRAILRGKPAAGMDGAGMAALRSVLPGQLYVAVAPDRAGALAGWQARSATGLAGLAAALALLLAGRALTRRQIERLQDADRRHVQQLAGLATAAELLSRLRDVQEIVARAEAIGRGLLGCERVEVVLGAAADERRPGVDLLGADGTRLGRISVVACGDALGADHALLLEHFARAVASALEGATLLADTMRAKSELELILSTISDGMFVLDRAWCIRYANAAAARYLQHRREGMLGAPVWTLFPGLREADFGRRLQAAAGQGQDAVFTTFYAPLTAWYDVRAYPFAGGVTVYFRDVTAQRETEEKLRQAQKLEAVGQLTGGIAHDVNNLLTVILGNLELMAMRAEDRLNGIAEPDDAEPGLDLTLAEAGLRAGESASQLMHRLLAFSRRQPLSPQVVAVGELLQSLQPLLRRTLSEQVALRMRWPAELWHALVDPAELESAILNLAINAQDAMPGGGTLTIEAANVTIDRVYAAAAGVERTGDFIMISASDTGTGMPKEVIARAFDPFFTTKAPGKGTGLGLSMVYGFVRQSGGHVLIDSEPGQGTLVRMYLPRTGPPEADGGPAGRADVAGGHETILLVEDNELVRAHTEAMLRGLGYRVLAAADGAAAARVLESGLRPDLLLTDVILPGGMTGRDVAEMAQRSVPGLRVLFISGYSGNVLLENGRLPPGVDLLGKPFRRSELASRIRAQPHNDAPGGTGIRGAGHGNRLIARPPTKRTKSFLVLFFKKEQALLFEKRSKNFLSV